MDALFEKATCVMVMLEVQAGESQEDAYQEATLFFKLDTCVKVDNAANKDVTFTYEMPYLLTVGSDGGDKVLAKTTKTEYTTDYSQRTYALAKDTVVLKKGQTEINDYITFRGTTIARDSATDSTIGFVIREKENDGNYTTDPSVWAGVYSDMFKLKEYTPYEISYTKFKNMKALDSTIKELNTNDKEFDENVEAMAKMFTEEGMTFTHTTIEANKTSVAKGVQTGDSNELGLWIALGMMAGLAAAAYALKRREN